MKRINARAVIRPFAVLALAAMVTQASLGAHVDVVGSGEPEIAVDSQPLHPDAVVGAQGRDFFRGFYKHVCGASILLTMLSPAALLLAAPSCYYAYYPHRFATV